jgi:hypothetical protein
MLDKLSQHQFTLHQLGLRSARAGLVQVCIISLGPFNAGISSGIRSLGWDELRLTYNQLRLN